MKAIVCTKYGSPDVLELREVDKPTPGANEVLVRVMSASVTAADSMIRRGTPFYGRLFLGLLKHKKPIPGTGFAGVIEAIGSGVRKYKTGDAVFGETGLGFSANAEYLCVAEEGVLANLPNTMSHEEAAPVCDGALTSLCFLKDIGNIQPGQKVLINGASGSLGSAGVQIAKYYGAEVTAVCSTTNLDLVKSLGADHVIDYTQEEFTQLDGGKTFDIIYDAVGKSSYSRCKTLLKEGGLYLSPVLTFPILFQMLWTSQFGPRKAKFAATGLLPAAKLRLDLDELGRIFDSGQLRSIIDKRYPLEQAAEAHRYVDSGHKKGNIVLTF